MLGLNVEELSERLDHCADFQTVGSLLSSEGIITARLHAQVGELCEVSVGRDQSVLAETIGFRDGHAMLLPFEGCDDLQAGSTVFGTGKKFTIKVGEGLLGRVIDGLGRPIDAKGPIKAPMPAEVSCTFAGTSVPDPLQRSRINAQLPTGIRVVDSMIPLGRGQRIALLAGSGVGKSTLLGEIAIGAEADINVVALIGERGREVRPFVEDCLGEKGMKKTVVVVATADQQPIMRIRATYAAVAIADYFRSQSKNVLFFLDSITRFATSQREVGLLLGEPPTLRGYPPSVFQEIARILEQMGTSQTGSISSVISVLVEGDDLNEPIADSTRSIADGHIVLDRTLAEHGHFPAISIGKSLSRVQPHITTPKVQRATTKVRDALATYSEVEDLIRIGAYQSGTSLQIDKAIHLKSAIDEFVRQPRGEYSTLESTHHELFRLAQLWSED